METDFDVTQTCHAKADGDDRPKMTTTKLHCEHSEALNAMPTVHLALKQAVAFGASTTMNKTVFRILKLSCEIAGNQYTVRSQSLSDPTCFESNLTKRLKTAWK